MDRSPFWSSPRAPDHTRSLDPKPEVALVPSTFSSAHFRSAVAGSLALPITDGMAVAMRRKARNQQVVSRARGSRLPKADHLHAAIMQPVGVNFYPQLVAMGMWQRELPYIAIIVQPYG